MDELDVLIRARYPILYIETFEEDRALQRIRSVLERQNANRERPDDPAKKLWCWTVTKGLHTNKQTGDPRTADPVEALAEIGKLRDPGIVVLKDFHHYLSDHYGNQDLVVRMLRDLNVDLQTTKKTIVILAPATTVPADLQKAITVLDMPLPTYDEIGDRLDARIGEVRRMAPVSDRVTALMPAFEEQYRAGRDDLIRSALGLTLDEAENVYAKCIAQGNLSIKTVIDEKQQIIRKSGILEYYQNVEGLENVGGLDVLKGWIRRAERRFSRDAEAYGVERPRGLLLVGLPGTGKSLSAKVTPYVLRLPLLRMDMSSIASKWYGETTNNIKAALKLADAVSPAVFWWDEVEKMISTGGDGGGHEETLRALGVLLTHMEESTAPILRVATCNTPYHLPPEFLQRFERIFFVDLPTGREREEIWNIHLRHVGRDPVDFAMTELVRETEGYVGREIRTIIKEGLGAAFFDDMEVTTDHFKAEIKRLVPMSKQKQEEIDRLRTWAERNAVSASLPDVESEPTGRAVEFS
jgi:ATP-dependent 26S proteasome regulatory subunit